MGFVSSLKPGTGDGRIPGPQAFGRPCSALQLELKHGPVQLALIRLAKVSLVVGFTLVVACDWPASFLVTCLSIGVRNFH